MSRRGLSPSAKRKSRDLAALIPLLTLFLLMPPLVAAPFGAGNIAGVPWIVVYLFGIWAAAIALTAWNARRLARAEEQDRRAAAADYPG